MIREGKLYKDNKRLYMTTDEIVSNFRRSNNPERQIGVLAQLNAVPRSVIISLLHDNGLAEAIVEVET